MSEGLLVVISGPTGSGKGSIRLIVNADSTLKMEYSISVTTRKPREFEKEGRDYFFVSKETFQKLVEMDDLLEYSSYGGDYYGTRKSWIREKMDKGENVSIELDPKGASDMIAKYDSPHIVSFFIIPPNREYMRQSMESRGHSEKEIKERLDLLDSELSYRQNFDYLVLNDSIQHAADLIRNAVLDIYRKGGKPQQPKGLRLPGDFKTDLF